MRAHARLSAAPLACALMLSLAGTVHAQEVPTGPLPRTVVPTNVALELKLDPKQARFSGSTRIHAKVAQATDVVWMHGRGLAIGKAEATIAGGQKIALTASEADVSGVLRLKAAQPLPAGEATIDIAFEAPFGELQGAYRVKPDGNDYVVTQMEPLGARNTFPGFDEPSFKQPWDITLIVPEDDVAVANTAETKTERLGDGWKKVTYARTEALPSYLIAFAVGPWDVPAGPDIAPNAVRKAPIRLRGVAAEGQGGRMRYSLANTPAIVAALEAYFGTPYPFDKLDNVAAPDFWAGAMENAGLIVYRDSLMFPDESSSVGERQSYWGTSAHELAHQWFGDLVTMRWWDDLWLNEGFATWMGNKITQQLQPGFHADRGLLEGALNAMRADSLATTRRIHEPIEDFTDIQSAFDGITYQKGGATLYMFEQSIGEQRFRDGVRKYLAAHARGNATSADLIAALAAQSDDAKAFDAAFKSYIDQPGVPFLTVDVECGAGKPALLVRQQRYLPIGSKAGARQTWGIPFAVRYADGGQVREAKGWIDGAQSRFELAQASACPQWVMPNAHGAGYYRYTLAPKWQQALTGAFAQLDEREQRVYADAVTSAYGAGTLASADVLAALPQFAAAPVRQTASAGLGEVEWMRDHLATDDAQRARLLASVAAIYRPRLDRLGLEPKQGESDDDRLLRGTLVRFFADVLDDAAVRKAMAASGRAVLGLGGSGALDADAAPRDLRGTALSVAVEDGGAPAFDAAEKHFRAARDATLRQQLLGALGAATDPKLAQHARALAFEPGLLRRNEIVTVVGRQVDAPATREAARQWLEQHFVELEARLAPAGARLVGIAASGMCSAAEADALTRQYAARMKTVEGGPRELAQAAEAVQLCAAAKDARKAQPLEVAAR